MMQSGLRYEQASGSNRIWSRLLMTAALESPLLSPTFKPEEISGTMGQPSLSAISSKAKLSDALVDVPTTMSPFLHLNTISMTSSKGARVPVPASTDTLAVYGTPLPSQALTFEFRIPLSQSWGMGARGSRN